MEGESTAEGREMTFYTVRFLGCPHTMKHDYFIPDGTLRACPSCNRQITVTSCKREPESGKATALKGAK